MIPSPADRTGGRGKSMGMRVKRGNKHHPEVSEEDKERNELISRVRARVEKVFGTLKPGHTGTVGCAT